MFADNPVSRYLASACNNLQQRFQASEPEIESFDGQADGYSLTPYVRVQQDDELSLEIARLNDSDEPVLAYQWQSHSQGAEAYQDGMAAISELGLGPVTQVELDDGTEVYDLPIDDSVDHPYDKLQDLTDLDPDVAVAVRITAADAIYENDTADDFENLEAPYSEQTVGYAVEQADISISADQIHELLEDDVL